MTKVIYNPIFPAIDREEFLTPFDKMFDQIIETSFPDVVKSVGVKPFKGTAYPKINVYEWDTKVGVIAEIPGLSKKDLSVEVTDGVLTISGDKHKLFDVKDAKVLRRELKESLKPQKTPEEKMQDALSNRIQKLEKQLEDIKKVKSKKKSKREKRS